MVLKKPYAVADNQPADRNFDTLFEGKLESRFKRDGVSASAIVLRPYQSMECGEAVFSANGSPTTARTFVLAEKRSVMVAVQAHAQHAQFIAAVTDVTACQVTIECISNLFTTESGRSNFSSVTNGQVRVWWQILGSR